jgi:peptidoglycan hydrolase-like protein with peptidoglycan-binding domain
VTAPFNAGKHPRSAGGKFGATGAAQAAAAGKPTGAWAAGPIRRGTGHGKGKNDPRVLAMQRKLNALGIGDEHGHSLRLDGDDGAHTTAAVKKFQASHGMPATGVVDAKTMVAILTAKPSARPARKAAAHPARKFASRSTPKRSGRKAAAKKPGPAVHVERVRYQ